MKKAIVIAAGALLAGVVFIAALVVVSNLRGGLDPSRAGLKKVPLIGALVNVKAPPPDAVAAANGAVTSAGTAAVGNMSYLRFGDQARLSRLAQELAAKKAQYDALQQETQRRARELEAWEHQLKVERDTLMKKFQKEKEDLAARSQELDQRETTLKAAQVKISKDEAANLKTTAGIYDKMQPAQAASILTEMYDGPQKDSVVKIISLMQDRSAAKLLEAFTDAKIGAQITEQLQRIARPAKAGG